MISDKYCVDCGKVQHLYAGQYDDANFCFSCGGKLTIKKAIPYIGVCQSKGIYRVTCVIEKEFRSLDHAEEDARHSSCGDGSPFDNTHVKLIRSMTAVKTHPYICGDCKDNGFALPLVSAITGGQCENCGSQNWLKRDEQ